MRVRDPIDSRRLSSAGRGARALHCPCSLARPVSAIIASVLQSGHNVWSFARYVEKPTDSVCRGRDYLDRDPARGEIFKMSAISGSARSKYAGLMPIGPLGEFVRPFRLKPKRFLITFCTGVSAISLWQSYGDAARETIAHSYPQHGWLAQRHALAAQNPRSPDMLGHATPAVHPTEQLIATSFDLDAGRQDVDEIATTIATGQMARSGDKTVTSIATDQEQMTRSINETVTRIAQLLSAKGTGITVESRADATSLPPTVRLNIKPAEAKSPKKQPSVSSAHDPSCLPSALAVLQNRPGGLPSWTLRAPGHEGTKCWHAAARPGGSDHRPKASDYRTVANELFPASVPHPPQWWTAGLP